MTRVLQPHSHLTEDPLVFASQKLPSTQKSYQFWRRRKFESADLSLKSGSLRRRNKYSDKKGISLCVIQARILK